MHYLGTKQRTWNQKCSTEVSLSSWSPQTHVSEQYTHLVVVASDVPCQSLEICKNMDADFVSEKRREQFELSRQSLAAFVPLPRFDGGVLNRS